MAEKKQSEPKKEAKKPAAKKIKVWHTPVYDRKLGKINAGTEVTAEQSKTFDKAFIDLYAR